MTSTSPATINPHLAEAIALFKELGWHEAPLSSAPTLPLGSAEQQKIALKGLRTGDWSGFNPKGKKKSVLAGIDRDMLGFFAVRLGVDVKRAARLLDRKNREINVAVIQQRGAEFATEFVQYVFAPRSQVNPLLKETALELVLQMGLEHPTTADFYDTWLSKVCSSFAGSNTSIPLSVFRPTFSTFLEQCAEYGTYPVTDATVDGYMRGWVSEELAVKLTLDGIESAESITNRKGHAVALATEITPDPKVLLPHLARIGTLVATLEPPLVEALAVPLIPIVADSDLADIALAALYVTTKKTLLAVLKALRTRENPDSSTKEALSPRLEELSASPDATTAKHATALLRQWGTQLTETPTTEPTCRWEDTPKLWELPRFSRGAASVEKLAEVAQILAQRGHGEFCHVLDIHIERLLALTNELARTDRDATRLMLKTTPTLLDGVFAQWAKDPENSASKTPRFAGVARARLRRLIPKLGQVPCLLSEPSYVDMSITADDLVTRLAQYDAAGVAALESDLQLALARLNLDTITDDTVKQLAALNVPLELENGTHFDRTATQVAADYLTDPFTEPAVNFNRGFVQLKFDKNPASLEGLPIRFFSSGAYALPHHWVFPHFGNAAFTDMKWGSFVDADTVVGINQAARHGTPLPPAAVINLLAMQRLTKNGADCSQALLKAWQRGLITPGVADISFLDWQEKISNLKALALALDDAAHLGLLSVVWPVLDDLIGASLKASSLIAGTADVAAVMEKLAPAVADAIKEGRAPHGAAAVPHLRALAARRGKNNAVTAAKKAVAVLPATSSPVASAQPAPTVEYAEATLLDDAAFRKQWITDRSTAHTPVVDGAQISLRWENPLAKPRCMRVDMYLPHLDQTVSAYRKTGWFYDIVTEQQCEVFTEEGPKKCLRWDESAGQLVLNEDRGQMTRETGVTAVPQSLLPVLMAFTCDEKYGTDGCKALKDFIGWARYSPEYVADAVRTVLPFEQFNPAKAAQFMAKQPQVLSLLWPLLTESLRHAAAQVAEGSVPRWLNKVLEVVYFQSDLLASATVRGHIPATEWAVLHELGGMKKKCAARDKAMRLAEIFDAALAHG